MKRKLSLLLIAAVSVACTELSPEIYDQGLTLDKVAISASCDGGEFIVGITAKKPWKVTSGECPWINLSRTEGASDTKVIVTVQKNTDESAGREAELTFTSGEINRSLTITQDKLVQRLSIDKNIINVPNTTESVDVEINITSNIPWSVSAPEGIEVTPASGEGNGVLKIHVPFRKVDVPLLKESISISSGESEAASIEVYWACSYANTFIVDDSGSYSIGTLKADGTSVHGIASAAWVYATEEGFFSNVSYDAENGEESFISFDVNSEGGYGVIAALDQEGKPLWSWTIWRTETPEDIHIGEDIWMDRNVGAWSTCIPAESYGDIMEESAMGCLYQWGRKDPFPGGSTATLSKGSGQRENSAFGDGGLQVFFNSAVTSGFEVGTEDTPWTVLKSDGYTGYSWSSGTKSAGDPCPAGYMMPESAQMLAMKTETAAWNVAKPFKNSNTPVYTSGEGFVIALHHTGWAAEGIHFDSGAEEAFWTTGQTAVPSTRALAARCVKIKVE